MWSLVVLLGRVACPRLDAKRFWIDPVVNASVQCLCGSWWWFAKPFGTYRKQPKILFCGVFKKKLAVGKKMGLTGAPSLQRSLGGFPRNRKTKVEQVQKELLWQRPSIHVWPRWKLVWSYWFILQTLYILCLCLVELLCWNDSVGLPHPPATVHCPSEDLTLGVQWKLHPSSPFSCTCTGVQGRQWLWWAPAQLGPTLKIIPR